MIDMVIVSGANGRGFSFPMTHSSAAATRASAWLKKRMFPNGEFIDDCCSNPAKHFG